MQRARLTTLTFSLLPLWIDIWPPYRIRNYHSAMARLTCAGLIDCAFLSSLRFILPTDDEYPDLTRRPIDGPNKLGNYMVGAA